MSNQATLIETQQLWWLLKERRLVWAGGSIHQLASHTSFWGFPFTLWLPTYTFVWIYGTQLPNLEWCTDVILFEGKWRGQHPTHAGVLCLFGISQLSLTFQFLILPPQIFCHQWESSALKTESTAVAEEVEIFWFSRWPLGDAANHSQSQN